MWFKEVGAVWVFTILIWFRFLFINEAGSLNVKKDSVHFEFISIFINIRRRYIIIKAEPKLKTVQFCQIKCEYGLCSFLFCSLSSYGFVGFNCVFRQFWRIIKNKCVRSLTIPTCNETPKARNNQETTTQFSHSINSTNYIRFHSVVFSLPRSLKKCFWTSFYLKKHLLKLFFSRVCSPFVWFISFIWLRLYSIPKC